MSHAGGFRVSAAFSAAVVLLMLGTVAAPAGAQDCGNAASITPAQQVSVSISGTARSYFRFDVPSHGPYQITTLGTVDTKGWLLDAGCNELVENDDGGLGTNFLIEVSLLPGTYYVAVGGFNSSASGSTTLVVLSGGTGGGLDLESAPDITGSGTARSLVSGSADLYYAFSVTSGDTYMVYTSGSVDTVGGLYSGDGRGLAEDDDGGSDTNFLIERDLAPGNYYVGVRAYGSSTSGRTSLHVVSQREIATAVTVPADGIASGSVSGFRSSYFRLNLDSDGNYVVYSSGPVDVIGELLDGNFRSLAEDDDGGEASNFMLAHAMSRGTYYVGVRGYNAEAEGAFTLHVEPETPAGSSCDNARPIDLGSQINGSVDGTGRRYYSFSVDKGGNYRLHTLGSTDTRGQLLDGNCQLIAEDDDGGEGNNFLIGRDLGPGTYHVAVSGYNENTSGPFVLLVESAESAGSGCYDAVPVPPGEDVSGFVQGTVLNFYSFVVSEGGSYRIYTSGGVDTVGQLLDSGCNVIVEDDDSGAITNFQIDRRLEPGTYYVAVRGYGDSATGQFLLRVDRQ